jgi:ribokinase
MPPLNYCSPYHALIGTGGIGSGIFFALQGDHTLGREESRGGRFLDQRDYCKLHIIAHYVKVLLGPSFETILVSRVGQDAWGSRLMQEMEETGLDTRYVQVCPGEATLISVCLLYPDGSGGNLTAVDSACERVDAAYISQAEPEFARRAGQGIALAAPEVPLAARLRLLQLATDHQFLRAASFTSAEMLPAARQGLFALTDLLSLNLDEAAALLGWEADAHPPEAITQAAAHRLLDFNPALKLAITAGKSGSWTWEGDQWNHLPAIPVQVSSSAGAGDAFLAGLIAGTAAGLPWFQAHELAGLAAALSVTSPHTIHPGLERDALRELALRSGISLAPSVESLLDIRQAKS